MLEYVTMIFIGLLIGILNYSIMKYSINKFIMEKKYHVILVSFFARNIAILSVFYILMGNNWKRLLLLLLGFVIAKFSFLSVTQFKAKNDKRKNK